MVIGSLSFCMFGGIHQLAIAGSGFVRLARRLTKLPTRENLPKKQPGYFKVLKWLVMESFMQLLGERRRKHLHIQTQSGKTPMI